jgi:hypothetical protein
LIAQGNTDGRRARDIKMERERERARERERETEVEAGGMEIELDETVNIKRRLLLNEGAVELY